MFSMLKRNLNFFISLQLAIIGVRRSVKSYPVLEEVADNARSADADAMSNQLMNIFIVPIDNF